MGYRFLYSSNRITIYIPIYVVINVDITIGIKGVSCLIMLIAFLTMAIDHIGIVFYPDIQAFQIIGRFAFPLFAWGIARGYRFTRNEKLYASRLLIIAVVAQVPFFFLYHNGYLNICFTLLAGLLTLIIYHRNYSWWIRWLGIMVILVLAQLLRFEYGSYGVLTILFFSIFWGLDSVIYYQAGLTLVCVLLFRYDPIQLVAILAPILILYIKQKDFKLPRVFQYSFYPVHMLLLLLIQKGGYLS